jgi:hypothetical protein
MLRDEEKREITSEINEDKEKKNHRAINISFSKDNHKRHTNGKKMIAFAWCKLIMFYFDAHTIPNAIFLFTNSKLDCDFLQK